MCTCIHIYISGTHNFYIVLDVPDVNTLPKMRHIRVVPRGRYNVKKPLHDMIELSYANVGCSVITRATHLSEYEHGLYQADRLISWDDSSFTTDDLPELLIV